MYCRWDEGISVLVSSYSTDVAEIKIILVKRCMFFSAIIKPYTLFIPIAVIVRHEVGKQSTTEQIRPGKDSEVALCFCGKPRLLISLIHQGPKI